MSLFNVVIPGRPVQNAFQQLTPDRAIMPIESISTAQHVCVFLTGPLAEGFGASVYMSLYPFSTWSYLGAISNEKPSALFRFRWPQDALDRDLAGQLGISIEPLPTIAEKEAQKLAERRDVLGQQGNEMVNTLGRKMTTNLSNYMTSCAQQIPGIPGQWVPAQALDRWLSSFNERIRTNPNFWSDLQ
ncbi:putative OPI10 family protein [Paratrimastix pyriformis]|uniref:OPI10 family protein n=1 Tax=Paratrimastix pyriformis TaxID=342808 RepID=A0ABQ8UM28_9EUKA|nr:putative OPI10 family protein [Paratrimastix pyriformis]